MNPSQPSADFNRRSFLRLAGALGVAFGVQGVAGIAYLVGFYALIGSLLNTFDVSLPGTELG